MKEIHWVGFSSLESNICQYSGLEETSDKGIDIILEMKDGTCRLIQVKYRHAENKVRESGGAYVVFEPIILSYHTSININESRYAMFSRSLQKLGTGNVSLEWIITNGQAAPHHNEKIKASTYVPGVCENVCFETITRERNVPHIQHQNSE